MIFILCKEQFKISYKISQSIESMLHMDYCSGWWEGGDRQTPHKGVWYLDLICLKASTSFTSDFYKKLIGTNWDKKFNVNNWDQNQPHLKSA